MRVIGTAGHVDHGKSTLIHALSGIHPDRLKEEREREMTIDLGFAWMDLPSSSWLPEGEEIGIIDVPGHRDFIENMLSGIGGIDAALFVIAADEGVMPQTREHLAILDILNVKSGVLALTKIDLIEDEEWLDLVEEEILEVLAPTALKGAPIVRVSARTKQGLPQLIDALGQVISGQPPRPDLGRPRLPVDRVFSIAGFGTVVTGTLTDGSFRVGDEVDVLGESNRKVSGRIRGLQTHKRKEEVSFPGSRTAINISGVNLDQIQRGFVITHPGDYQLTRRVDVRFKLLPEVRQPLKHNTNVKIFIGAAEEVARVRLLGVDELHPGESAWLQLELQNPVVAVRSDHYILRRPSPGETLGGGKVINPHPGRRYKRFSKAALKRLEALTQGDPSDVIEEALIDLGAAPLQDVLARANLETEVSEKAVEKLVESKRIVFLDGKDSEISLKSFVIHRDGWEQYQSQAMNMISEYHLANPLRKGMPKEELKSRLKVNSQVFNSLILHLKTQVEILEDGPVVYTSRHVVEYTPAQQSRVDALLDQFSQNPYNPPTIKDCLVEVGEELYNTLIDQEILIPISPEVVFRSKDYHQMIHSIKNLIKENGVVTAGQVRDYFQTSRRYVLALLEHMDGLGITIREGDQRRLRK